MGFVDFDDASQSYPRDKGFFDLIPYETLNDYRKPHQESRPLNVRRYDLPSRQLDAPILFNLNEAQRTLLERLQGEVFPSYCSA